MTAKTAADAGLEAFRKSRVKGFSEDAAVLFAIAAARDWTPPPEPTLGEINKAAWIAKAGFSVDTGDISPEPWQAGGEACARVGAERERAEVRALICKNRTYSSIQDVLALIDARGKEQP